MQAIKTTQGGDRPKERWQREGALRVNGWETWWEGLPCLAREGQGRGWEEMRRGSRAISRGGNKSKAPGRD